MSSRAQNFLENFQLDLLRARFGDEFTRELAKESAFVNDPEWEQVDILRTAGIFSAIREQASKSETVHQGEFDALRLAAAWNARDKRRFDPTGRGYSRYESPIFAQTIEPARQLAEAALAGAQAALQKDGRRLDIQSKISSVPFGSVHSAAFGASAIRVDESDEHVVVFNVGLPQILARFARIFKRISSLVPLEKFKEIAPLTKGWTSRYRSFVEAVLDDANSGYLLENFIAAIHSYLGIKSDYRYDHLKFLGAERMQTESVVIASEAFILLHEYNHILDGHAFKRWHSLGIVRRTGAIQVGEHEHMMEHAADISAASLLKIMSYQGIDSEISGYFDFSINDGIALFYATAMIIELVESNPEANPLIPNTHPPANERMKFLCQMIDSNGDRNLSFCCDRFLVIVGCILERIDSKI